MSPLALWEYAGSLQMLGRHGQALAAYEKITQQGAQRIAVEKCGEGLARAKGLIADCYYRMMDSLDAIGERVGATEMLVKHLDMRGPGCESIYALDELSREARPRPNGHPRRIGRRITSKRCD